MSLDEYYNSAQTKNWKQMSKAEATDHVRMSLAGRMQQILDFKSSGVHSATPTSSSPSLKKGLAPSKGTSLQKTASSGPTKKSAAPSKGTGSSGPKTASSPPPKKDAIRGKKRQTPSPLDGLVKKVPKEKQKKKKGARTPVKVEVLKAEEIEFTPIHGKCAKQIPELSYGLDRVLFNQGVYHMQDERTGVFNFDPYLASIMPREEFDYSALGDYITSSKDVKLREMAAEFSMKFCGSTSSLSAILSQFHFLLSAWRPLNYKWLSQSLRPESFNFTIFTRAPAAAFARYKDGVYAIDADKEFDVENILSTLGRSMEKLLTLPKEEFERYRRTTSHEISEEERNAGEAYHYATIRNFLVRSQLDAQDNRLPGTGVFDLKTRAVITIRMDVQGYEKGLGYEIRQRFGNWESFEREYYDMIRSAFLKYSLQVRMGRMDGIFVAFHNTERIFGFQYISLPEMDQAIHGTDDMRLGDSEFKLSFGLFSELLTRAANRFPEQSLRFLVETRDTKVPLTYFFAEPMTEEEVDRIQAASKPSVEQIKNEVDCNLNASEAKTENNESQSEQQQAQAGALEEEANDDRSEDAWKELMSRVEDIIENDSLGTGSVRDAVTEALRHCGLSQALTEREGAKYMDHLVTAVTAHLTKAQEAEADEASKSEEAEMLTESDELVKSQEAEAEEMTKSEEAEILTEPDESARCREAEADEADEGTKSTLTGSEELVKPLEAEADEGTKSTLTGSEELTKSQEAEADEAAKCQEAEMTEESSDAEAEGAASTSLGDLIIKARRSTDDELQRAQLLRQIFNDLATQSKKPQRSADSDGDDVDLDETEGVSVDSRKGVSAREGEGNGASVATKGAPSTSDETASGHGTEAMGGASADDDVDEATGSGQTSGGDAPRDLIGMYVTIRNKVNDEFVERATSPQKRFNWDIEYSINEMDKSRAQQIYREIRTRRKKIHDSADAENRAMEWHKMFGGRLPILTKKGREYRAGKTRAEAGNPVRVVWAKEPLGYESALGAVGETKG
ncbi:hypothetical protein L249_2074 [Ophiocordyceps polyrhachis-furcata BCC 54312]|uniref:Uncharacterized protein n=1 Tax=Ophiocordyceps polyrhachis-furcata BCC 54312 TaxID=1330021 RepID=A0A367LNQ7_9HYPO|nr:hypothetical protein L249_2074 [Ophiocordyceps polyrhachis-furcata BCC 54312]